MTMVDFPADRALSVFSSLLGHAVQERKQLRGGRNTRVYLLTAEGSRTYCGKIYFRRGSDQRDRLRAEFFGLDFLWNHGVRCVPRPVAADPERGAAVYEFVHGSHLRSGQITRDHIQAAVSFLAQLKSVSASAGSERLPLASEAVFSVAELTENIGARLQHLQAAVDQGCLSPEFATFVGRRLPNALTQVRAWVDSQVGLRSSSTQKTPEEGKTLSPSDFGFHNALQRPTGEIVFLDFEYFGWDDAAKTISDFLLHPAMELGMELKRLFFVRMIEAFSHDTDLAERVRILYPLFGLKWCMILLNEFLPEHLARRSFSGQDTDNVAGLQSEQLAKSERMLQRVLDEYERFPYRIE